MKLRRLIKGIVFSSLSVGMVIGSVVPTEAATVGKQPDLDDKNRLSLDEFSLEDQESIINAVKNAGYADAIEEEHVEVADTPEEIGTVKLNGYATMSAMTDATRTVKNSSGGLTDAQRAFLQAQGIKTVDEAHEEEEKNGGSESNVSSFSTGYSDVEKVDVKSIQSVTVTGVPAVSDEEVKADFRYGLKPEQMKDKNGDILAHRNNNCLKMRIQLEKMFNSPTTISGPSGILGTCYYAGTAEKGDNNYNTSYMRAYVNSANSKDLVNNKAYLAQLAKETFADIDGTESYAYQIPTAVYYGLIDVETVTAEKAAKSNGKYKAGDLLCHAKDNVTYAKLSKMYAGYDGFKRNADIGKLKGTQYAYVGNLDLISGVANVMTPDIVNKTITKGEFLEQLFRGSGSIKHYWGDSDTAGISKVFKDTPKAVELEEAANAMQDRSQYMTLIANPKKGVPEFIGRALMGANKAGMTIKDANGNSNWYKTITVGDAITLMQQAASLDE